MLNILKKHAVCVRSTQKSMTVNVKRNHLKNAHFKLKVEIEIDILEFLHDHPDKYSVKANNIKINTFVLGFLKSIYWISSLK